MAEDVASNVAIEIARKLHVTDDLQVQHRIAVVCILETETSRLFILYLAGEF